MLILEFILVVRRRDCKLDLDVFVVKSIIRIRGDDDSLRYIAYDRSEVVHHIMINYQNVSYTSMLNELNKKFGLVDKCPFYYVKGDLSEIKQTIDNICCKIEN